MYKFLSAKSSRDWTVSELMAYNISISSVPAAEFFPIPDPPLPDHIDQGILDGESRRNLGHSNLSDAAVEYLGQLDRTISRPYDGAMNDYIRDTLKLLGFNERRVNIATHFNIPFDNCKDQRDAQTDVCLVHQSIPSILLIVLNEDKSFPGDAEPRVIGAAIAAFQYNNWERSHSGYQELDTMTIPCIIMSGISPTFYLVPVTTKLNNAVMHGTHPTTQTQVMKCLTLLNHTNIGMGDIVYRKLAFKRFLAFKELAKRHWMPRLQGPQIC
jgi:hypothetical protein